MEIRSVPFGAHGRPTPLHGQVGEQKIVCDLVMARTRLDGVVTDAEQAEEDAANDEFKRLALGMAAMCEGLAAAIGGADGLTSRNFLRIVHRAERARLIPFPASAPMLPDAA